MICKRLRSTEKDAVVAQVTEKIILFFLIECEYHFIMFVIKFKGDSSRRLCGI